MIDELRSVGPVDGLPVLYFHSPATACEEMADAESAAGSLGLRVSAIPRPLVAVEDPGQFVAAVAQRTADVIDALGVDEIAFLAWSGGAPYALAAAAQLGSSVTAVHLVSPVPGPLTGPDAVPDQTERLRQVAASTAASEWISSPAALRDYQAVAAPWPFDVGTIASPVTIWSPDDDEVVPPRLVEHLAAQMPNVDVVRVEGGHDWLMANWATVLARLPAAR